MLKIVENHTQKSGVYHEQGTLKMAQRSNLAFLSSIALAVFGFALDNTTN